jgi:hypothetical protein
VSIWKHPVEFGGAVTTSFASLTLPFFYITLKSFLPLLMMIGPRDSKLSRIVDKRVTPRPITGGAKNDRVGPEI